MSANAGTNSVEDVTSISIEDLLQKEVVTVSKIAQQISNSPSAVSIVTAKDIQTYGYRTLAEIIDSMRGLNTINDRVYTYMSGRGFGRPADYPGRIMLLIDGQQANDSLYNSSYLGTDGLLDTELIERVEYVSGPGGVTYGNGAFYGIINVFTKKGASFNSTQVALDVASNESYKKRITFGKVLDNGADVLFSASSYQSQGDDYFINAFNDPSTNFGISNNLDHDRNLRLFFKGQYQSWGIEAAFVNRKKEDPTPSYGADFNAKPSYTSDLNSFINLSFEDNLNDDLKLALRSYLAAYDYEAKGVYSGIISKETNTARWFGLESKFVYSGIDQHQLLFGVELRKDYKQDFYLDNGSKLKNSSHMLSAYIQDEFQWNQQWTFNFGARGDFGGKNANFISPRVAAIYSPTEKLKLKASYASAFRRANPFEKYYDDGSTQVANTDLKQEVVDAKEVVLEYSPDDTSQLLSSLYFYDTKNLIESQDIGAGVEQFINVPKHSSKGFDIEYNKKWQNTANLKLSYAWQYTVHENGELIANSPKHLAKLNFRYPLFQQQAYAGIEMRYIGERLSESGALLDDHALLNLSASSRHLIKNMNVSASVKNLFNASYAFPAPTYYPIDTFEQSGRMFWLQTSYDIK